MRKKFLNAMIFTLALVTAAFAGMPAHAAVDATAHTCADLQAMLRRDGQIEIKRLLGSTTYYSTPNCSGADEARVHYEWAYDTNACELGWDCVRTGD